MPCEVASGLRSHGFEAKEDDAGKETMCRHSHGFEAEANTFGMMRRAVRHCDERHALSGFKEGDRKDGMIAKNCALSNDDVAYRCNGTNKSSEVNAERKIVKSVENIDRCDESNESDSVNAMRGISSDVKEANRCENSYRNVENASCKLGTGGVVCPSVANCEKQIVRRQHADCKLGTGGVVCPSAKDDAMNARERCASCKLGTGGVVCPSAKMQVVNEQRISCELGVGGVVRPNATEGVMEDDPRRKNHAAVPTWF